MEEASSLGLRTTYIFAASRTLGLESHCCVLISLRPDIRLYSHTHQISNTAVNTFSLACAVDYYPHGNLGKLDRQHYFTIGHAPPGMNALAAGCTSVTTKVVISVGDSSIRYKLFAICVRNFRSL